MQQRAAAGLLLWVAKWQRPEASFHRQQAQLLPTARSVAAQARGASSLVQAVMHTCRQAPWDGGMIGRLDPETCIGYVAPAYALCFTQVSGLSLLAYQNELESVSKGVGETHNLEGCMAHISACLSWSLAPC